jgi:hypothetical protein
MIYKNMENEEIISSIQRINVVLVGQAGCEVQIELKSKSDELFSFIFFTE